MTDGPSVERPEIPKQTRQQPTKETFRHLRHKIQEKFPEAQRIFSKSGTTPTPRQLINEAGQQVRAEIESETDPDTGLPNKRGFLKRKEELARIVDPDEDLAVGVIDIDNLKEVNDTQGHSAGDLLIKNTAEVITYVTRESDIAARVGGDEFKIILTKTNPEMAVGWQKRIREELATRGIHASVGVQAANGRSIDESLLEADKLMYTEKREHKRAKNGRNVIVNWIKQKIRI